VSRLEAERLHGAAALRGAKRTCDQREAELKEEFKEQLHVQQQLCKHLQHQHQHQRQELAQHRQHAVKQAHAAEQQRKEITQLQGLLARRQQALEQERLEKGSQLRSELEQKWRLEALVLERTRERDERHEATRYIQAEAEQRVRELQERNLEQAEQQRILQAEAEQRLHELQESLHQKEQGHREALVEAVEKLRELQDLSRRKEEEQLKRGQEYERRLLGLAELLQDKEEQAQQAQKEADTHWTQLQQQHHRSAAEREAAQTEHALLRGAQVKAEQEKEQLAAKLRQLNAQRMQQIRTLEEQRLALEEQLKAQHVHMQDHFEHRLQVDAAVAQANADRERERARAAEELEQCRKARDSALECARKAQSLAEQAQAQHQQALQKQALVEAAQAKEKQELEATIKALRAENSRLLDRQRHQAFVWDHWEKSSNQNIVYTPFVQKPALDIADVASAMEEDTLCVQRTPTVVKELPLLLPGTIRIAVGEALQPHRLMVNHGARSQLEWNLGASMDLMGWKHKMEFLAFPSQQPGTIRIAVGEAYNPHRIMVNHGSLPQIEWDAGASMSMAGWSEKMEFWAFPSQQPGTIRIAVGEAYNPHRIMVNHGSLPQIEWDDGASMSTAGWSEKMEFWAFPPKLAIPEHDWMASFRTMGAAYKRSFEKSCLVKAPLEASDLQLLGRGIWTRDGVVYLEVDRGVDRARVKALLPPHDELLVPL